VAEDEKAKTGPKIETFREPDGGLDHGGNLVLLQEGGQPRVETRVAGGQEDLRLRTGRAVPR
jgi:hypothetical protein